MSMHGNRDLSKETFRTMKEQLDRIRCYAEANRDSKLWDLADGANLLLDKFACDLYIEELVGSTRSGD